MYKYIYYPENQIHLILLYCYSETLEEDLFYFSLSECAIFIDFTPNTVCQSELVFTFIMFYC